MPDLLQNSFLLWALIKASSPSVPLGEWIEIIFSSMKYAIPRVQRNLKSIVLLS